MAHKLSGMDSAEDLPARADLHAVGGASVVETSARWWHLAFYLCFAGTAVFYAVVIPWPEALLALAPLAVIVVAYSVLVIPDWPPPNRGRAYVLIVIVCFVVATMLTPYGAFMYFFALGHIWMFSGGLREVVIAFIVLAAGLTAGIGIRTGGLDPVDVFLQVVVPCAASFAMGLWIDRIIRQSEDRAELLRALRRTQDELARAHHLAGAAAERERVARDIHDTLAQGFTSIVLLSEAGLDQVRRPAEAEATLRAIRRVAHDNLGEARALVQSGQQRWDDSAFLGALERTCARAQTVSPGRTEVRAVIDQSATGLDVNEKIMILRGLQEALANVIKHAEAASVTVTFTADEDTARLSVSDDGIGFDPAADRGATDGHGHFGLPSMRQRAAEIGADLAIASRPGQGTRLDITVARTGSEDGHA